MYKHLIQVDWDHYQDSDDEDSGNTPALPENFENLMKQYQANDSHVDGCDSSDSCESEDLGESEESEESSEEEMPPLESTECSVCKKHLRCVLCCLYLLKYHPTSLRHVFLYS